MNSKFQIPTYNNASFKNSGYSNEKIHYTPLDWMIHNFLDILKIKDYEITIYYIAPSQNFHPLSLIKDKHDEELKFPTLFYSNLDNFIKVFHINK